MGWECGEWMGRWPSGGSVRHGGWRVAVVGGGSAHGWCRGAGHPNAPPPSIGLIFAECVQDFLEPAAGMVLMGMFRGYMYPIEISKPPMRIAGRTFAHLVLYLGQGRRLVT